MISVIIPVLNESASIGQVVEFARRHPQVREVIVVDDGSIDGTPETAIAAGARVITSTLLGKGASMDDGRWAAQEELLVYLDGDLDGLSADLIDRLTAPLIDGTADFAKASFSRRAGRVTTLTAKPLLRLFFPHLAYLEQPLGGIIAVRRSLLRRINFESDYGVDVGLLLDAAALGARIAQVDVGHIEHDSQPLEVLGDMAMQVVRTILDRAARYNRLDIAHIQEVQEVERHMHSELAVVLEKLGRIERLALIDMDGVLLNGRFIVALAERCNRAVELADFLDHPSLSPTERTCRIASLFAGVPAKEFEDAAVSLPLMPAAADTVVALRRAGYRVGIVTDSYRIASEVIRRRVFADFSIAHLMRFRQGKATGAITLSSAMKHPLGCNTHEYCKLNVMHHLTEKMGLTPEHVLAIGDGENDICLLRAAGLSVAFRGSTAAVRAAAMHSVEHSLAEVLPLIHASEPPRILQGRLSQAGSLVGTRHGPYLPLNFEPSAHAD